MTDRPRPDEQGPPPGGPPRAAPGPDSAPSDDEVVEAELLDDEGFGTGDDAGTGPAAQAGGAAGAGEAGPSDADLDAAAAAVEVDLELLLAEREEFLGAYRRTQADFENYRKQSQRRQDDAVVRTLGNFVEGLLPVLDACDAAVAHGEGQAVEPIVTALYGVLELSSGTFRFVRAGHELPVLFDSKSHTVLESKGIPLGIDPGRNFNRLLEETSVELSTGRSLLLYTDGLTECWNVRGACYTRERLLFSLGQVRADLGTKEALDRILGSVAEFAGDRPQEDDMTAVLLKRTF